MSVHQAQPPNPPYLFTHKTSEHLHPFPTLSSLQLACIGVKVIASCSISPMRKDVLAKCYGGDISRKKKLLNKQAKGKKRMKSMGKVNVPQEAFMAVLKMDRSGGSD